MRFVLIIVLIGLLLMGAVFSGSAQEEPPAFATNTPQPPEFIMVTPAAAMNRYTLRPWTAADLQNVLATYIVQLDRAGVDAPKAVRLIQYELGRRFPGAPRDAAARETLLHLMLAAPRGSVDMRSVVRPSIETLVNQQGALRDFDSQGFHVEVETADFDGQDPGDVLLHVRYGDLYEEYLPTIASDDGSWHVLSHEALPAAPLGMLESLDLIGLEDYNGDGLDEVALALDWGQVNAELRVLGWRNGALADLVQPGSPIYFGEMVNWVVGTPLDLRQYRVEDSTWDCLGEQNVTVEWRGNLYRASADEAGFFFQNTANCLFYGAEPFFAMPIDDALQSIDELMEFVTDEADPVGQGARMIRAMLLAFRGDVGTALAQALQLQSEAKPDSWLAEQATILASGLQQSDIHPLEICAALVTIHPDGACNVDDALGRFLEEQPLRRDAPIAEQLAELGIQVQAQTTVSQIGMADREIVRFDMAGTRWWAFAPLDREFYQAERADPIASMMPADAPLPVIVASQSMVDALLRDNDPATVLTTLANLKHANPLAAISPEVRFLEALSLDLLGDRSRARQAYFELWQQDSLSIWGQLAAAHLEQR